MKYYLKVGLVFFLRSDHLFKFVIVKTLSVTSLHCCHKLVANRVGTFSKADLKFTVAIYVVGLFKYLNLLNIAATLYPKILRALDCFSNRTTKHVVIDQRIAALQVLAFIRENLGGDKRPNLLGGSVYTPEVKMVIVACRSVLL